MVGWGRERGYCRSKKTTKYFFYRCYDTTVAAKNRKKECRGKNLEQDEKSSGSRRAAIFGRHVGRNL